MVWPLGHRIGPPCHHGGDRPSCGRVHRGGAPDLRNGHQQGACGRRSLCDNPLREASFHRHAWEANEDAFLRHDGQAT